MQRNFILTDVMKTGFHMDLENFISMNTLENQEFEMTGEYYSLHNYDLDTYDRKFAMIDTRWANERLKDNNEFHAELKRRCNLLHSQGFVFIKTNPWESLENIENTPQHPEIDIEHIKWTGGVSWFWFYMYNKHYDKRDKFTQWDWGIDKIYDFLYLNKRRRPHRNNLWKGMSDAKLLGNSLTSFLEHKDGPVRLNADYELPWVDAKNYPQRGMDQDLYEKPYNESKYSLISETNDTDNEIFMTEKIWKPIIAQQVFIVHGNYLYLQKLREIGFKTFGQYFNESYDLERDPNLRVKKLVNLCKDLLNKNWKDIYLQSVSLRKHNYDTFWNREKLSEEINKVLVNFLEFADSGQVSS